MTEKEIIALCRKQDRKAQKFLYERYAPKFFGVCKRYVKNREDAEDVMIEGIFKILMNIEKYEGKGSFEGWMRRIVVNECLMFLRKKHNFHLSIEGDNIDIGAKVVTVVDELAERDILDLLNRLPTGYRTIFNLYVVEGFKHREIAEMLNISINTSKSQLILAKKRMKNLIEKRNVS